MGLMKFRLYITHCGFVYFNAYLSCIVVLVNAWLTHQVDSSDSIAN